MPHSTQIRTRGKGAGALDEKMRFRNDIESLQDTVARCSLVRNGRHPGYTRLRDSVHGLSLLLEWLMRQMVGRRRLRSSTITYRGGAKHLGRRIAHAEAETVWLASACRYAACSARGASIEECYFSIVFNYVAALHLRLPSGIVHGSSAKQERAEYQQEISCHVASLMNGLEPAAPTITVARFQCPGPPNVRVQLQALYNQREAAPVARVPACNPAVRRRPTVFPCARALRQRGGS